MSAPIPTPRTDAIKESYANAPDPCAKGYMHRYADLTRQLERELAQAVNLIAEFRTALSVSDKQIRRYH